MSLLIRIHSTVNYIDLAKIAQHKYFVSIIYSQSKWEIDDSVCGIEPITVYRCVHTTHLSSVCSRAVKLHFDAVKLAVIVADIERGRCVLMHCTFSIFLFLFLL